MKQLDFFETLEQAAKPYPLFLTENEAAFVDRVEPDISHFVNDNRADNSREAKQINAEKFNRIEKICYSALHRLGEATHYEVSHHTCLTPEQCRKRLSALCNEHGVIEPCGKRKGDAGVNVTIWKIK